METITHLPQIRRPLLRLALILILGLRSAGSVPAHLSLDPLFALTVRVFLDTVGVGGYPCPGCNGILDSGDRGVPLPPMQIVVRDGETGQELARQWTRYLADGGASYAAFLLPPRDSFVVELADIPAPFQLCPNSPREQRVAAADFAQDYAFVSYSLWYGCPVPYTPTPPLTPSPTPSFPPTSPVTTTATPTGTSTPLATPTATGTPTPSVRAIHAVRLPLVGKNFCPAGATITGLVWEDGNGDGLRDPEEPPLAHAILTLWAGDVALQSHVTGEDGQYDFSGLVPGLYRLVMTDPPGYRATTAGPVRIEAQCGVTIQDFGAQVETACPRGVSGVVWHDLDGDGMLGMGEPPLSEATLTLRDSATQMVDVQITGGDGIYLFEDLAADVYVLVEDNPPGFPVSSTLDNWAIDLLGCRVVTINFGDQAAPSR